MDQIVIGKPVKANEFQTYDLGPDGIWVGEGSRLRFTTPGGVISICVSEFSTDVQLHDNGPYEHTVFGYYSMHHKYKPPSKPTLWQRIKIWFGLVDDGWN